MGLKIVHVLFIVVSILLTIGFAGWCFHEDSLERNPTFLALGVVSTVIGLALMGYGAWFVRKSKKIID